MNNSNKEYTTSLVREKASLFTELALNMSCSADWDMSENQIKEYMNRAFSGEIKEAFGQDNIDKLIHRFQVWNQQIRVDERKANWAEFRTFVRSLGIKLKDFDRIIRQCASFRQADDLLLFLVTYHLLAQGRAPQLLIEATYGMIFERAFDLFSVEFSQVFEGMARLSKRAMEEMPGPEYFKVPSFSTVTGNGFMRFLVRRGKHVLYKVAVILITPYSAGYEEPERWVSYLFSLKGEEVLPILHVLLNALIDVFAIDNLAEK
ncbi:MAG: hypothetical protein WBC50_07885 [Dehalococcoidales bacterium]